MKTTRSTSHLVQIALGLALMASPATAEDCLKRVFDKYCLGGEVASVPKTAPDVTVRVHDGRIAWVERRYTPGTMLMYHSLIAAVEAKYGPGIDKDFLPGDAERVISRGKGWGLRLWPMGQWLIRLIWATPKGIVLRYADTVLEGPAQRADDDL